MKDLQELNSLELQQIQGGGPISDWVACKVRGFINMIKDTMTVSEDFDYDSVDWEKMRVLYE